MKTKDLVFQALLAALYVVLTVPFEPISFGPIQFRISELLMILIIINPKHSIGIILGCFVANFASDMPWDILIGTFATALAAFAMSKTKNENLALVWPAVMNGVIIAAELYYFLGLPFFASMISIFLSELVIVYLPGKILLPKIRNNERLLEMLS